MQGVKFDVPSHLLGCTLTSLHLCASGKLFPNGKKKKAGSLWKLPALSVVPEAGIEPARLAAGDFESPASTNSTTRAEFGETQIMAQ